MKQYQLYFIFIFLGTIGFMSGCQDDMETFGNKVYIDGNSKVGTLLVKKEVETLEKIIRTAVPKPAETDLKITYRADSLLAEVYNLTYFDNAIALPEENYEIPEAQVMINKGSTKSTDLTVCFKNLTKLDHDLTYVLPVTISEANIPILESARTTYFILKGAALINTVANIRDNKVYVAWKNSSVVSRMYRLTAEALVRADKFDNQINTLMGIEEKFLIRMGDAGVSSNQLQVATEEDKVTSSDWIIPTKEWVHVAVTFEYTTGRIQVFINGKKKMEQFTNYRTSINWGVKHSDETNGQPRCFWIGYSYNGERNFNNDICECRIWNRVLTEAEINAKDHFYFVDPTSSGLVAYWKFNDETSTSIKDYTVNGNNATASKPLIWKQVELPQKNK